MTADDNQSSDLIAVAIDRLAVKSHPAAAARTESFR